MTFSLLIPNSVLAQPPPTVTTDNATNITINSATLNGNLMSLGGATTVTVYFEYGETSSYGSTTTVESMTGTGIFTASATGLIPGTIYHFRARANGGVHGSANGTDMTFITNVTPPAVTTSNATGITSKTATISGNLISLGTATSANVFFEYGTTPNFGSTTPIQSMTGTGMFTANLTVLADNTTYHFRAKASGAHGTANGASSNFTTLTSPRVVTGAAVNVTTNSAAISGSLTSLGTATTVIVYFEYGPTTSYGSTTIAESMTGTGQFGASLSGLAPGTTYHFRARAEGREHGTAAGADMTLATLPLLAVSTSAATNIKINSATVSGNLISLGTAATVNVFFEYGTTIAYGSNTSAQVMTSIGAFSANLLGLSPGTTYHFRARADGGVHGTALGNDMEFTALTPLRVNTAPADPISIKSATLNGNLISLGEAPAVNVFFEYGDNTSYGSTTIA
ncbi:MAG: hypothetical protein AABZ77_04870, partial [Chloroflexota bacterium]